MSVDDTSGPRVPDDTRNWNAIDIFLFSNGQHYSPPRKYHLKSEELKWWDTTLEFLARSQFGSLHSNIELYTLDGKKIEAPLELANDAAYVAVKAPDAFVQAGYEKYLLKASRSREKRQERLNSIETEKSANLEIKKEQFKSNLTIPNDVTINGKKLEERISVDTEIEYSTTVASNTFTQSQKDTENLQEIQTINNSVKTEKPEVLPLQKPINIAKNTILKKICPNTKSVIDRPNISKKRNTSFPKNIAKPNINGKRLTISSNDTNTLKTNIGNKVDTKEKPNINANKISNNVAEAKEKPDIIKNGPIIRNYSSEKDLTVLSDVYKNTESDIQSVYLDADRKTALLNNDQRKVSCGLENIEEYIEMPKNDVKTSKAVPRQSAVNSCEMQLPDNINQPGTINLNLNIDLKSCTLHKTHDKNHTNKSYVTLIKPEKASQINIDVSLCNEDDSFRPRQSIDNSFLRTYDESIAENNTKMIVIPCRCNLFKHDNTASTHCYKENENYIFVIPNEINNKFMQRGEQETQRQTSDKEIQETLHSCIRVPVPSPSEMSPYKKPENVTKHKVSISQEAPTEFNPDNRQQKSPADMHTITSNDLKTTHKIDNCTQTDWCNTLVQAKIHEDGRYTFHFPPLQLLANYNLL